MTHITRVSRNIETYRIGYRRESMSHVRVKVSAALRRSAPDSTDVLATGEEEFVLRSTQGTTAWELAGQLDYRLLDTVDLTAGVDYLATTHRPFAYDQEIVRDILGPEGDVFRQAGTRIPATRSERGELHFANLGCYAQAYARFFDRFSVTAGVRVDHHDVYRLQFSPRAALVLAPHGGSYFVKLLYGASFKPPSAEQLYTEPAVRGDVLGHVTFAQDFVERALSPLDAQRAHSWEAAGGIKLGRMGHAQANVYATFVEGRVEYVRLGAGFVPHNEDHEWVVGAESELRLEFLERLHGSLGLGVAKSVATISLDDAGV